MNPCLAWIVRVSRQKVTIGTAVLTLALAGAVIYAVYLHGRATSAQEELAGWNKQLNDSTWAKIAKSHIKKNELPALSEAAKKLNGTLVGGVSFHTRPDTVFVPVKEVIQSTVLPDSTRVAVLDDTTKAGYQIRITAEAPKFPAPLKLGYTFIAPKFEPQVGFVKVGGVYAAVVSWAGKEVTIDTAFFAPSEQREPVVRVSARAGVGYLIDGDRFDTPALGLQIDVGRTSGLTFNAAMNLQGKKQISVGYSRLLWSR